MLRQATTGSTSAGCVLNERVDRFQVRRKRRRRFPPPRPALHLNALYGRVWFRHLQNEAGGWLEIPLAGVFDVADGLITRWTDCVLRKRKQSDPHLDLISRGRT